VIPGTIEMEDYDAGGQSKGYFDTTPANEGGAYRQDGVDIEYSDAIGSHVRRLEPPRSEWLKYTANVTTAGTYDVSFKVSSPSTGTSFKFSVDGADDGHGLGPEHRRLEHVHRGQEAGHPAGRQARPPDHDHRVPQPLTA
jgi:hypothetical protein